MESALTRLAAFPAAGIIIKAATTSTAIQHFIRLRTDLSRAPETVVAAEPFRRALSEIWVEFDPNGSNAGGFILLIAAARRLEPLSTVESERMVAALQRIIDMTLTARSATATPATNIQAATVTASPSSVTNTTSTRATRSRSSSLPSLSSVHSDSISSAPALSRKRSVITKSVSPRLPKRPRTNQERSQDLDELNRNSTTHRYFDANAPPVSAMIATAILTTLDKRATVEKILEYFTQNYPMNQSATSWEQRIGYVLTGRPYFSRVKEGEDSSTAGAYWEIIEGDFKGPLDLKGVNVHPNKGTQPSPLPPIIISIPTPAIQIRSWKDLITEAILSSPDQRMSVRQMAEYLMEKYDDSRAQGLEKVRGLVNGGLRHAQNGFRKGDTATERVGNAKTSYYYHILESGKVESERVEIGRQEKEEDRIEMEEEQESSEIEEEEEEKPVKLELDKVKEEVKMEELVKVEIKEEDWIEMEEEQESSEAGEEEEEKSVELDKVKEEVKIEESVKMEIKEELEEDKKWIVKIKKEE